MHSSLVFKRFVLYNNSTLENKQFKKLITSHGYNIHAHDEWRCCHGTWPQTVGPQHLTIDQQATQNTQGIHHPSHGIFLKQIFKWLHPKTQREKMMVLLSWQIIKQCWQFFSFFISIFCQWSLSFCRCGCFFKLSSSHLMNQMVFRWTLSPWCITELFHERNDWIFIESPTSRILICPVCNTTTNQGEWRKKQNCF